MHLYLQENILITDAGRASIADFGLSRVVNSNTVDWSLSTSNHGKGGSARWLAPECLIQGERCTYSSDVYAFGGVCYEVNLSFSLSNDMLMNLSDAGFYGTSAILRI